MLLRVNDRGPASPGRMIAVSPRAALLLACRRRTARVRVQLDEALSRRWSTSWAAARGCDRDGPAGRVTAEACRRRAAASRSGDHPGRRAAPEAPAPSCPTGCRNVCSGTADPGTLYLRCGSFGRFTYANRVAASFPDSAPMWCARAMAGRRATPCAPARSPPSRRPTRRWTRPCAPAWSTPHLRRIRRAMTRPAASCCCPAPPCWRPGRRGPAGTHRRAAGRPPSGPAGATRTRPPAPMRRRRRPGQHAARADGHVGAVGGDPGLQHRRHAAGQAGRRADAALLDDQADDGLHRLLQAEGRHAAAGPDAAGQRARLAHAGLARCSSSWAGRSRSRT